MNDQDYEYNIIILLYRLRIVTGDQYWDFIEMSETKPTATNYIPYT